MLARAFTRSLQSSGLRATASPVFRTASSQWTRSMARHNRPNQPQNSAQNKPIGNNAQTGASPISKGTGTFATVNNTQQGQTGGVKSGEASQGEPSQKSTSPEQDDLPFSSKQEEFNTSADPTKNTEPRSEADNTWTGPLPDLTKGIPSTLEFETAGSTKRVPLNLTEADRVDGGTGPSGRAKGELPASAYVSSSEKRRLKIANYMYSGFAIALVAGTLYLGRNWESEAEENAHQNAPSGWGLTQMWNRAKARFDDQLDYYTEPTFQKLLPDPVPGMARPYTLVISMEDMLVHSEWSREHGWRLAKRPGMDYFLRYLQQYYEIVLWTSQPYGLVEGLFKKIDPFGIISWPLFREATRYENGEYVKDLSFLNRDLSKVIMIDTVPSHAKAQPENAIILPKWTGQIGDKELVSLIPFLEYIHTMNYSDVRKALRSFEGHHIPTEFARRELIARKKFEEELAEHRKKTPKRSGLGLLGKSLGIKHQNLMVEPGELTPAEALAQGKMLQDLAREQGQKRYEILEKDIRENGEKWLKEEAEAMKKAQEEQMKAMKSGFTGFFGSKEQ